MSAIVEDDSPDPETVAWLERRDGETQVLEFFRSLTDEEKAMMLETLRSPSDAAFRAFEAFYRKSRGLTEAQWPVKVGP